MTPISKENVLVIVPAFNDEASIVDVIWDLLSRQFAVLVASDGSTDETALIPHTTGARVLNLPINLGVGGALRAGFKFAVAENTSVE